MDWTDSFKQSEINEFSNSVLETLLDRLNNERPTKIVTLGTSLTADAYWVSSIEEWLKLKANNKDNLTIKNLGIHGGSSIDALSQMVNTLSLNPDVVFIEFSINDAYLPFGITLEESKKNLIKIIEELNAYNEEIIIILQTMNNPIGKHLLEAPYIDDYYEIYREISISNNLLLIDHYPIWMNLYNQDSTKWKEYVPDGLHPNEKGCINIIVPSIKEALLSER